MISSIRKYKRNVGNGFETWSRTVLGVDGHRFNERSLPRENRNNMQVASGNVRDKSRREICIDIFQVNRGDTKTSTQMMLLHVYVAF